MDEHGVRLVCFEICGEKFAFNMEHLVEIVQVYEADITRCCTPVPMVRGRWNYREKAVYVIDIRELFGLPMTSHVAQENPDQPSKPRTQSIILITIRDQIFGLLTDTVLQMVPLNIFYEYPDLISSLPRRYFAGVSRINMDIVIILAIENFLNEYELEALGSMEN